MPICSGRAAAVVATQRSLWLRKRLTAYRPCNGVVETRTLSIPYSQQQIDVTRRSHSKAAAPSRATSKALQQVVWVRSATRPPIRCSLSACLEPARTSVSLGRVRDRRADLRRQISPLRIHRVSASLAELLPTVETRRSAACSTRTAVITASPRRRLSWSPPVKPPKSDERAYKQSFWRWLLFRKRAALSLHALAATLHLCWRLFVHQTVQHGLTASLSSKEHSLSLPFITRCQAAPKPDPSLAFKLVPVSRCHTLSCNPLRNLMRCRFCIAQFQAGG